MSRYIDADAFLEDNKEFADREIEHPRYQETVRELIDAAPSIDIVRCKECKHFKTNIFLPNGSEVKCVNGVHPDDFCSYGKREGE